jgi:anaerobic selenocysteine-containing dehydrogenase
MSESTALRAGRDELRIGICKVCWAGCPIEVTVENGRATKVVGDRQSPIYGGYTCPKGRAMPEGHYSANRLLHAQRRRADGSHESIATADAIDEIAAKLQSIIDRHGPEAIALYPGNGNLSNPLNPVMGAMFIMALGTFPNNFFSVQTIDQAGKVIAQALHGRWIAGPNSFATSDTWMFVGTNPVISKMGFIVNPGQAIKKAVKGGMKLIVIDPRETESAVHAFLHIRARPGQDPTLLAGFLHVILAENLYDADFVRENAVGLELLRQQVSHFTPAHVASVTGVPEETILLAARTFAGGRRGCVVTGTGSHFPLHGTLAEYLALCINTVCGRWIRAGETLSQPHVLLPEVEVRAQPRPPYQPWDSSIPNRINNLPQSVVGAPTGTLADQILTPGAGQIRALICSGSNPMVSLPDQVRTSKAFASLELLVSLDVEMSNTARVAHYVIPDKMSMETPAVTQFSESMKYYGIWTGGFEQPYAMYAPATVDPPVGSDLIESWEFLYEVAKKLGKQLVYQVNAAGTGQHWDKYPVAVPLPLDRRPTTEEMFEFMCTGSRVPLSEVKRYPHGKVFDDLINVALPRSADCDAMLDLGNATMLAELHGVYQDGVRSGGVADALYPLLIVPRRANEVMNSIGRSNPKLGGKRPYNPAFLHPSDLEKFGVAPGDVISIRSRHGQILGVAKDDTKLTPGTLSMSHCYGPNPNEASEPLMQGGCTSRLMDANVEFDPIFGQPKMGAIPVSILRVDLNTQDKSAETDEPVFIS